MSKKITIGLSAKEFRDAARQVEQYKKDLNRKNEEFCRRLVATGNLVAQAYVSSSGFGKYVHLVSEITSDKTGCRAVLYMEDTSKIVSEWRTLDGTKNATVSPMLMLEFGSGVKAQNPAGISGVGTGTFPGQTHAEDSGGWWYMDLEGNWHHSTGISPKMPMYNAAEEMRRDVEKIAREVFGV